MGFAPRCAGPPRLRRELRSPAKLAPLRLAPREGGHALPLSTSWPLSPTRPRRFAATPLGGDALFFVPQNSVRAGFLTEHRPSGVAAKRRGRRGIASPPWRETSPAHRPLKVVGTASHWRGALLQLRAATGFAPRGRVPPIAQPWRAGACRPPTGVVPPDAPGGASNSAPTLKWK